ncbi:MAG: AbrB/MazE/SpoVT family DNA-binding domain-containing protein [Pseudomonadota bacterium]
MVEQEAGVEVQIGAQGRMVIPAALRKALNIEPGECLVARRQGNSLVLERRGAIEERLKQRFREVSGEVDLADELARERRSEAKRERESS